MASTKGGRRKKDSLASAGTPLAAGFGGALPPASQAADPLEFLDGTDWAITSFGGVPVVASGTDTPLAEKMRRDWNERGSDDARHWTVNCVPRYEWQEDNYLATGEQTVRDTLDNWLENMAVSPVEWEMTEIGCGAGRITLQLSKRFKRVNSFDVSDVMVDETRRLLESKGVDNVRLFVGDGLTLQPLYDNSQDLVYSAIVMQHIPDYEGQLSYLRETARILKPGGKFMISYYADYDEYKSLKPQWEARRSANNVMGWSDLAKEELHRFETSMSTPMPREALLSCIDESGLEILTERGANTVTWWVAGRKKA